jgi:FkbM family methyltransferase
MKAVGMASLTISPRPGLQFRMQLIDSPEPAVVALRRGEYPLSLRGVFSALETVAAPPSKVLDLGGYIGGFGLAAAAAGYEVAIVEANPRNAARIRDSARENTFAYPVKILEAAVGSAEGTVTFCADGPHGHVQSDKSSDRVTATVRQMTFAQALSEIGWLAPDFIKMDIEGSEGIVLRSALPWFAQGHRPILLFEANGHTLNWFGDSPRSLRSIVSQLGYSEYEVNDQGRLQMPSRFEPRCVMDYLASPTPLRAVLPARSPAQLLRRTAAALRSPSPEARRYTRRVLWNLLALKR